MSCRYQWPMEIVTYLQWLDKGMRSEENENQMKTTEINVSGGDSPNAKMLEMGLSD